MVEPDLARRDALENPLMNLIVICTDTLRADYLGCYGNAEVRTPNIDQLASQGVVFENAFAEGLPTLNARRVYFLGRPVFREWEVIRHKGDHLSFQPGWHGFAEDEVTLAEALQARGYTTALISDTYHMFKPTGNFHRGFDCWRWIRGQEADPYVTGPRSEVDLSPYVRPGAYERRRFQGLEQYLLNVSHRRSEEDYFTAQVLGTAKRWIEDNVENRPFFLWIDCFDPHEPWDPPRRYADLYCPDHDGIDYIWPATTTEPYTERELERIRALYMGEITFLDEWVGRVLATLDQSGIADETVVVFTSDHGTLMGEQGMLRKRHEMLIQGETRLPFIIRAPHQSGAGQRVRALVQAQDFMPTWLRPIGEEPPETVQGQDLWPLVRGEVDSLRDHVTSAYGSFASVRDFEWNYIEQVTEPYETEDEMPPQLYHLTEDSLEERNLAGQYPEVERKMAALLRDHIGDRLPAEGGVPQ